MLFNESEFLIFWGKAMVRNEYDESQFFARRSLAHDLVEHARLHTRASRRNVLFNRSFLHDSIGFGLLCVGIRDSAGSRATTYNY